ncbi:MAG: 50S ribosomal protein L24 [Eubacteriales bacterium]|jgi:large subunit ribosomal protein L24|nr:50S ribosomal protein L24 [Eubacteriales bacterium]MDD4105414.1 50S ribosomal protein L24 [Eubacteriales bacterium]MDD4710164.1 50S ribosomal protein L24 [Eubacteriales bacterium]NLO15091.1 50S ribosomal protein L24 [Clostridiales bacterium]
MKLHVKTKDEVIVITGKDKGVKGKVINASPKTGKVIVEGVAMVSKHQKSRAQGQPGGIIRKESAISASNVMLICQKCGKPSRAGVKIMPDGKKNRVCKKCGEQID